MRRAGLVMNIGSGAIRQSYDPFARPWKPCRR